MEAIQKKLKEVEINLIKDTIKDKQNENEVKYKQIKDLTDQIEKLTNDMKNTNLEIDELKNFLNFKMKYEIEQVINDFEGKVKSFLNDEPIIEEPIIEEDIPESFETNDDFLSELNNSNYSKLKEEEDNYLNKQKELKEQMKEKEREEKELLKERE